jgi:hypothetical protein
VRTRGEVARVLRRTVPGAWMLTRSKQRRRWWWWRAPVPARDATRSPAGSGGKRAGLRPHLFALVSLSLISLFHIPLSPSFSLPLSLSLTLYLLSLSPCTFSLSLSLSFSLSHFLFFTLFLLLAAHSQYFFAIVSARLRDVTASSIISHIHTLPSRKLVILDVYTPSYRATPQRNCFILPFTYSIYWYDYTVSILILQIQLLYTTIKTHIIRRHAIFI